MTNKKHLSEGRRVSLPVDSSAFDDFIRNTDIFELTRTYMRHCLENWYGDEPAQFVEALRADFNTVMGTYCFHNTMVSLNKNFNFEPAMDTVTCKITIDDDEGRYCASYQAVFDHDMQIIDDGISGRH